MATMMPSEPVTTKKATSQPKATTPTSTPPVREEITVRRFGGVTFWLRYYNGKRTDAIRFRSDTALSLNNVDIAVKKRHAVSCSLGPLYCFE